MRAAVDFEFEAVHQRFSRSERRLEKALDSLASARTDPATNDVTRERLAAGAAWREAMDHWEKLERLRVAYWRSRARRAMEQLRVIVPPLLAEVVECHRAAGDQTAEQHRACMEFASVPLPLVVDYAAVRIPCVPVESAALERADDEVF